ncbi:mannitol dehydrogenase family protein [Chelativorans sp. M5D2P16]|uniref:mannitol dehydrogenase family protein n=1 Tax=Chelativorans sp. M5D2P16 TaxID=3095678 RepID=UPI002ACAD5D8|nr:mannitol dehydrogenase family protein [Chelativorans sp. M5D2P16]MDZ5695991.1 mannitol dehydrogenase family protein [Chelativorans sp. M5D2P16]
MTIRLSTDTLGAITRAAVPAYDRAALTGGIVHFGVGNFHRAHQAIYLDTLFNTGRDHDWAIIGAGVLPTDAAMRERLAGQDMLTTVVEQDANRSTARVTGAMIDYLAPGDAAAIIAKLADPAIRIVSLTITEGGYFIDPASGVFDPTHPAIAADGASPKNPSTVFGLIAAGLKQRRKAGTRPFTVMSCDNIPHNGAVTRSAVTGLAALSDPELAAWIAETVAFPNGMVDRITPATGERERRICAEDYGIEDACPVFCEGFKQWVLEDDFPAGRPALEEAGVQFVPDVTPYENMKIRILNGGHAVIAYPSGLLDIHFVHEAMAHPLVRGFLEKVEYEEVIPVVPPVPDTDLGGYFRQIKERLDNPKIGDTVRRLCLDGSNRQPKFIVPTIADRLARGEGIAGLALESALWCRYCFGVSESGKTIEPNDPAWDRLQAQARLAKENPMAWLAMEDIYGEVAQSEPFRAAFAGALTALWRDGTEKVLARYLEGQG